MYKIIAIDGTSGSGKGTIAKEVAKRLNYTYIDTGAMYRCVALKSIENNISEEDEEGIVNILKNSDIKLTNDGKVYLDNKDVSNEIRGIEVTRKTSIISKIVLLRLIMAEKQRELAKNCNVVMEGRDITTVIFPNADYKFYIDADVNIRAKRRHLQNIEKGIESNLEEVTKALIQRDYEDTQKELGALTRTSDQHFIDNGVNTIEESVNEILEIVGE